MLTLKITVPILLMYSAHSNADYTADQCGKPPSMHRGKRMIRGGEVVTDPSEYPFIVGLIADGFLCTGALISPNYVLTAGHCFKTKNKAKVFLGARQLTYEHDFIYATPIVHPNYDKGIAS